jgi:hypothetical protein
MTAWLCTWHLYNNLLNVFIQNIRNLLQKPVIYGHHHELCRIRPVPAGASHISTCSPVTHDLFRMLSASVPALALSLTFVFIRVKTVLFVHFILQTNKLTPWRKNPKVHHRTHNSPPPVPVLSQPNPIHTPQASLPKIHSDPNLTSTPWSSERSLSFGLSHQNLVQFFLPCVPHVLPISFALTSPA